MDDAAYLKSRGWVQSGPDRNTWADPMTEPANESDEGWWAMEFALVRQRARDAAEERELHRAVMAARMSIGHAARDGGMVRAFGANSADEEAAEAVDLYRARFACPGSDAAKVASPPPPCTGAGTIPPQYQGMSAASSTGWADAPCGICGTVVAVDRMQRTVVHPWVAVDAAKVARIAVAALEASQPEAQP